MTRHYFIDREKKQIFVHDTFPDSNTNEYLGESDNSNIKAQASMFVRGGVGFKILIAPQDQP